MEMNIQNEEQLPILVDRIMNMISQSDTFATVICLEGDLGAGKTTLSKAWAQYLGISETVTSPTFVILKEYETAHDQYKKLIHIDAYRLSSKEELEYLGWEQLLSDRQNIILLEWPSMVKGISMPHVYTLSIEINKDHSRTFNFK